MNLYRIYWRNEISCAHQLLLPYESKCRNLHGHNFNIEVWIEDSELNSDDMIVDYSSIKKIVFAYDHKNLNDFFMNPTSEILAKQIHDDLRKLTNGSIRVRVWEDKDSYAEYSE